MKNHSIQCLLILLIIASLGGLTACSKKPEDATKQLITNLFDACKGGKNSDVASQMTQLMPEKDKQRLKKDKIDYSNADDKRQVDNLCQGINMKYGSGYEFGKATTQGEAVAWEVFPKGGNEGQVWAFTPENSKYVIIDIDPAKR
jgi:hypothetical protein